MYKKGKHLNISGTKPSCDPPESSLGSARARRVSKSSMVGGIIAVYSGKEYVPVEIRFYMIGTYCGEYSLTYKPTSHGKPGVGATKGSSHVDKK